MTQDEALKLALEWLNTDASQKIKMAKHFIEQALAQPELEHNFCPRCGKRNKDIHTCTPPQD